MNNTAFPSASSHQLSPRSLEARKEMFKILAETLRAPALPNDELDHQEGGKPKSSFPKISNASLRKSVANKSKTSLGFHAPSREEGDLDQFSLNRPKSTNVRPIKKKTARKGKGDAGEVNKSSSNPSVQECHLNNVLRSANRCIHELREAKESLSDIVAEDDQLTRGVKKANPTEDHKQLAHVALNITNLCREAFIPAHRLNQTAIALYCAEDFLRYPSDIRTFDLQSSKGRIKLPDMTFNNATVMKLRQVVDLAAETYNKFNGKGRMGEALQEILFCILRGYQDFYAATLGCQEIFKVLLYTGAKDKAHLQQFLLALSAMDRSDLLVEIQELRRILDEIVIFLEKLSWGSFVVYRLAGGSAGSENLLASHSDDQFVKGKVSGIPTYPAYPLLKAKGPKKLKQKKGAIEDTMEPSAVQLSMMQGSSYNMLNNEIRDATGKQVNAMKKSKFSKKKNMSADVDEQEAPVGDANVQAYYKTSDLNFSRIDSNANRRSMMNLEK